MSERAAYSRVYWSIVDDEKFASIYHDDHHLAAWLRLLLVADQSYPASGQVPAGVRRASVKALADVGLIDPMGVGRYRIHGLDAERKRRSDPARVGAIARWSDSKRIAIGMPSHSDRTPNAILGRDEDEKRRGREEDEPSARDGLPNLDGTAMRALEERTGHTWSQAGERQLSEFDRLVGDHGLTAVCAAFDAVSGGKRMTARQLIWPALRLLEPFATVKPADDPDAAEREAVKRRRDISAVWKRRDETFRQNGHWEPEWGDPPNTEGARV
jgi:hypothetical protein